MSAPARYVIFSGGTLGPWALRILQEGDQLIGADRGALFLTEQGLRPDMALGDFDSVSGEERERVRERSIRFLSCDPVMKDWTDTEMAFTWALEQGACEIVMTGVLGSRWDHSLANVHLLRRGLAAGIPCRIVDEFNELQLMDARAPLELRRSPHAHVSLLPLSLDVHGITLEGFRYPLHEASLTIGQSLGISNVLVEETGTVRIREGLLLVIRSCDPEPGASLL
ncbi:MULTISPECIES: thiamine diphosphokinase [Paenibacillus]|uniref:thiamine diphosphokinase n=1 Tax=Paenibacillus TaxID=44249 RepID=UPI0022B892EB|nr:thiamine diphosphokinase [Paenibacillus caseinilyticus]MCZ8523246.1 thiamine diphosphokinase [Paenibacillus caseinilyticus]